MNTCERMSFDALFTHQMTASILENKRLEREVLSLKEVIKSYDDKIVASEKLAEDLKDCQQKNEHLTG